MVSHSQSLKTSFGLTGDQASGIKSSVLPSRNSGVRGVRQVHREWEPRAQQPPDRTRPPRHPRPHRRRHRHTPTPTHSTQTTPSPKKKNKAKQASEKRGARERQRKRPRGEQKANTQAHTRAPPPPRANPTPHVPHPPRNRQAQDHTPGTTTTDHHEEPPRTTHDTPPPTTRTTPTQAPPPQPAAPTAAAPQHTMVPPWMRYTPKTPFSQPTRDHHGTHQGDTAEDPPTVRPRHPLPAGSLPRAHPTPEQIAPPPPWKRYTPAAHRHSPPAGTEPGPQHAQDAATHRPADPANAIACV